MKILNFSCFLALTVVLSCSQQQNDRSEEPDFEITAEELETHVTPKSRGVITDYERLFSKEEFEQLLTSCNNFKSKNNIPVFVLTNPDFSDYRSFTDFADAVSEKWNICVDEHGILFVISAKLGEIRMISCPATEGKISDEDFDHVINNIIYSSFRKGKYAEGLMNALTFLEQATQS